jgi:hypothetical protein
MRKAVVVVIAALCLFPSPVRAWGLDGHRIIGMVAVQNLPSELPAFLQAQSAKDEIVYLQSEEDRLKIGDSQVAWDREWPTDHYLDVDDDGTIGGVVPLAALPPTRDDFEKLLLQSPRHLDAYNVGFLPYAILEGYEQVRSDFALWREAAADAQAHPGPASATIQTYREELVIHDIGIFSHFVGDGSQPLHVTVHYNGWGAYPNPQGYSTDPKTHAEFESDWVSRYMTADLVNPLFRAPTELNVVPLPDIERYLAGTNAQVVPFYKLKAQGAFDLGDSSSAVHADALRFTEARLAAASQMLDSLILTAWRTRSTMRDTD